MTRIRKLMLQELQRRNYSTETIRTYINAVEQFAEYFRQPPEKLGPEQIRQYQLHLLLRKLAAHSIKTQSSALRQPLEAPGHLMFESPHIGPVQT